MYQLLKICNRCNQTKPISEFDKDKSHKDGLNNWCKACKYEQKKNYRSTPLGHQDYLARNKKYRVNNVEKDRARDQVWMAVSRGRLVRPSICQSCGVECKPEAHHYNGYGKGHRYDIQWLCKKCHTEADKLLKEKQVNA